MKQGEGLASPLVPSNSKNQQRQKTEVEEERKRRGLGYDLDGNTNEIGAYVCEDGTNAVGDELHNGVIDVICCIEVARAIEG